MTTPFSIRWKRISTLTLLLIMFIDGVGMSLVLPLIGVLFTKGETSLIGATVAGWVYQLYYGGSLACFSGAMILGAPFLGQLSDLIGRKITLQFSLLGTVAGYLVCVVAIPLKSPLLFLAGRTLDGLTAGSIPVAQAMLADLDTGQNKMRSIGQVMFAVTSGYMFGPVIAGIVFTGGELSLPLYLPFLGVAGLSVLCLGLLFWVRTQETMKSRSVRFDLKQAFLTPIQLLKQRPLQKALAGFFLFQCAWTLFYQYLPLIQISSSVDASRISLLLAEIGVGMCIAFCVMAPKAQQYLSPKQWILVCLSLFTILTVLLFSFHAGWPTFQIISVTLAVLYALGYSAMLAYLLSIANAHQKGLILGSVASLCAFSAMLTALLGGTLTQIDNVYFFKAVAAACGIALLLFLARPKSLSEPAGET